MYRPTYTTKCEFKSSMTFELLAVLHNGQMYNFDHDNQLFRLGKQKSNIKSVSPLSFDFLRQ